MQHRKTNTVMGWYLPFLIFLDQTTRTKKNDGGDHFFSTWTQFGAMIIRLSIHVFRAVPWNPRPDSIGVVRLKKFLGDKTPSRKDKNKFEDAGLRILLKKQCSALLRPTDLGHDFPTPCCELLRFRSFWVAICADCRFAIESFGA